MGEIWKDIKGYEGLYQVSNYGCVRSLDRASRMPRNGLSCTKKVKGKLLKVGIGRNGYHVVVLCKDGKTKQYYVHRLVANAFIPNPCYLPVVNHLDCDKTNNATENLEWCTVSQNAKHSALMNPGSICGMVNYNKLIKARPVVQFSLSGEKVNEFRSVEDAKRKTGIAGILYAAKGMMPSGKRVRTAGGYIWRFEEALENGDRV